MRFEIANRGTVHSGTYTFIAQLPTAQGFTYTSPLQMSLGPGDRIENTLRFTQLAPQGGTFTVFVDPMHLIKESNKANNSASRYVAPASGYQQQPYQQYHYGY
ncbi:hypothetical protein COU20_01605 [Candidatus Kaiserbacteria bacterium CG10_big_fil_rev_8_21_14_0_10_59_10]|uniref:CARDB domain-containing protein n=1 Tax=Candidatus Kaiserbacteria bacterium CG10_big_fil_rev_8_21_14_0_10_59_10 TaxID=1974612 RepID=A0A2H0U897_9BACT|nr:MAG: hypothetical protein COU20_01605 [Candidatus Kaiserbacteria bacterium CG10_big_fil_rev_8_21_14_0_10_59_10]